MSSSVTSASQVLGMPSGHNVIAVEQTSFRHCVQICTVALSSMKDFLNNTQCRKCQECQVDSNVASLFTTTTRQQGTNNHVHNLLNNTRGKFQDHLTASWTESRFRFWPSIASKLAICGNSVVIFCPFLQGIQPKKADFTLHWKQMECDVNVLLRCVSITKCTPSVDKIALADNVD